MGTGSCRGTNSLGFKKSASVQTAWNKDFEVLGTAYVMPAEDQLPGLQRQRADSLCNRVSKWILVAVYLSGSPDAGFM